MKACVAFAAGVLAWAGVACRAAEPAKDHLPFELTLAFEGQESVDEARLARVVREELVRLEVPAPDKAGVDDAAFALELFYRTRGHADVVVEYEFDAGPPPRALFRIQEGPALRVRELTIVGPSAAAAGEVRALLEPMASGGIYDADRLKEGLGKIRDRYRELGHLRFTIDPPTITLDREHSSVSIEIALHEGPAFVLSAIEIHGGVDFMAKREARIKEEKEQDHKQRFLPILLPELEHALQEEYRQAGFPDVALNLRPAFDEATGDVRVTVEITPGKRVKIAHFEIRGNERTRDATILGVMGLERNSIYDSNEVRGAFLALYATGLFESVSLELSGTGPERTLVVEVVEVRSVQIRVEPGFGSYEGPRILLGIEENNFQGRAQSVSLEGRVSVRAKSLQLAWIDRDFLGTSLSSQTTFFVEQREEPSFDFSRRGFSFFLRRFLSPEWSVSSGYEFRPTNVDNSGFSGSLPLDLAEDPDSDVAALSSSIAFDDRDSRLAPTSGKQARLRFEWADDAFGSDTEFLRAQCELSYLLPLGSDSVLAASARSGVVAPFGLTEVIPLSERYFNGGENSVRSFSEQDLLPPGATGQSQGGESSTTLNLEFRHLLAGNLAMALFVDSGNLAEDVQDYLHFEGFRSGVGVGLRYLLPIGPVRLDFGVNPDPHEDEDEAVLHFSVGFPF